MKYAIILWALVILLGMANKAFPYSDHTYDQYGLDRNDFSTSTNMITANDIREMERDIDRIERQQRLQRNITQNERNRRYQQDIYEYYFD